MCNAVSLGHTKLQSHPLQVTLRSRNLNFLSRSNRARETDLITISFYLSEGFMSMKERLPSGCAYAQLAALQFDHRQTRPGKRLEGSQPLQRGELLRESPVDPFRMASQ